MDIPQRLRTIFSDPSLTQFARWVVILAPISLLTGVIGNEITASVISALFLIHCLRARDWQWIREAWVRILLLLWAYASLRGFAAEHMAPALSQMIPWIRLPLFGVACAYWLLPDVKSQRRLSIAMLVSASFLIADTLIQYHFGHDILGRAKMFVTNYDRLTGPFTKPRVGIITSWLLLPAAATLAEWGFATRSKARLAGACLLMLAGIVTIYLSGERMAFLLTLMGVTLFFLLNRRLWLLAPVLALLAFVGISYFNQANPYLQKRQVEASHSQISGYFQSPYGQLLLSGLAMGREHPLIGVGSGNFRYVCTDPAYGPTDEETLSIRCGNHTHNTYVDWLAENGGIGLGLFLAMLTKWVLFAWKKRSDIWGHLLTSALLCILVMRLTPFVATASQFVAWTAMPFWLIVGFLMARLSPPKSTTTTRETL